MSQLQPDESFRTELAQGATVAKVAQARGMSRSTLVSHAGPAALTAGYNARYRARWGDDPPATRGPSEAERRASIRRVLGHDLTMTKGGSRPTGSGRGGQLALSRGIAHNLAQTHKARKIRGGMAPRRTPG